MINAARIRRFLRLLVAPGSRVWRAPVQVRSALDAHNLRRARRRSDPEFAARLIERMRASAAPRPEPRPLSPPGTRAVYRGPVTARVGGRGITLDDAGEHGTDLDGWLLAVLGLDADQGGRTRVRLAAEVIEPPDPAGAARIQERLRLLGVAAEQRPADAGAADLLVRALAAWAIPGDIGLQTAVSWATSANPALHGQSAVSWADGGGDPERLLMSARRDGARLAQ